MQFTDMYPEQSKKAQPATDERVSQEGPIQAGSTMSWVTLVILFIVFRVIYEIGGSS